MSDALAEAHAVQLQAAAVGFDWPDLSGATAKLREELEEFDRALLGGNRQEMQDELGDLLFSVVNVSRFLEMDASEALRASSGKFCGRFERVKEEMSRRGRRMEECGLAELDAVWDAVKRDQTGGGRPAN